MWAHVCACTWDTRGKYRHMVHTRMWSHTENKTHAHIQDSHRHTRGAHVHGHTGHKTGHMGCSVNETCAKRTAWPLQAEAFSLWVLQAEGKGGLAAPEPVSQYSWVLRAAGWGEPSCTSSLKEGLCSRGGGGFLATGAPMGALPVDGRTQWWSPQVVPSAESLGPWAAHSQGRPWAGSWSGAAPGPAHSSGVHRKGQEFPAPRAPHLLPLTVGHTLIAPGH